jgi:hypothetical protein
VAAIINHVHNERYKEKRGFFGFFESVDDHEVAAALFDAARQWFVERGMTAMRGPVNPSLNYECGLLIDGFDSPPTFMMTYNPPYYAKLIEGCGFGKAQDLYALLGPRRHAAGIGQEAAVHRRRSEAAVQRQAPQPGSFAVQRRRADVPGHLQPLAGRHVGLYAAVRRGNRARQRGLRQLIVPELTAAAEVDGKMVGAVFGLLDYNPRIKRIDGRLFPFGFLRLLWNKRAIPLVPLVSTNVVPEFQKVGLGAGADEQTAARRAGLWNARRPNSPGCWRAITCPKRRWSEAAPSW